MQHLPSVATRAGADTIEVEPIRVAVDRQPGSGLLGRVEGADDRSDHPLVVAVEGHAGRVGEVGEEHHPARLHSFRPSARARTSDSDGSFPVASTS